MIVENGKIQVKGVKSIPNYVIEETENNQFQGRIQWGLTGGFVYYETDEMDSVEKVRDDLRSYSHYV